MMYWCVDCVISLSPLSPPLVFSGFGRKEVVECLIERGATVDIQDDGERGGGRRGIGGRGEGREEGREGV